MKSLQKRILTPLSLICLLSLLVLPAKGALFFEKTGGGRADTVYVAGNPDLYPIEYYDEEDEMYKGLIPDMLQKVSEETGIDFTYICAGRENRQKSLYENNQAELLTALSEKGCDYFDGERLTLFTAEYNGEMREYSIGFTKVISVETKAQITEALENISSETKSGFLVHNAQSELLRAEKKLVTGVLFGVLLLLAAFTVAIIIIRRKKREKAKFERMVDSVTGLGNGEYYTYAFNSLISDKLRGLYCVAYIATNTEVFREKNTGISLADAEKYAAVKLRDACNETEYLARICDGAFAFIFRASSPEEGEKRVSDALSSVNRYLAEFCGGTDDLFKAGYMRLCDNLTNDSEAALYNAKQGLIYAEKNSLPYHLGSPSQLAKMKKSEQTAKKIDEGLKNDEFKLHIQLITDGKTDAFCGGEVLSRWQNREFGLLRPADYMDALCKSGKIVDHDYTMFEKACRQLENWEKPPFSELFLTCNFTRLSASLETFPQTLCEIAERYTFRRARMVIEITEDTLSGDSRTVSENIRKLSDYGFTVAIDDMGGGFSSLADIYDNEIDIVKIDKDFISSAKTARSRQMLKDIVSLVHNAGAKVVCEGVENREQLELLKSIGCDMMQGFYNSRVLPPHECERIILSSH